MLPVEAWYAWLAQGPAPDVDRLLAVGLRAAEPAYAPHLVACLLERGNEASWAALITAYLDLPDDVRGLLHDDVDRFHAGISLAMRTRDRAARLSAIAACTHDFSPRLAHPLVDALRDASADVREAAAATLRILAEKFHDQVQQGKAAPDVRERFALAVEDALRLYDMHRRPELVEVALWFACDIRATLWGLLDSPRSHVARAVTENLAEWDSPRLASFLLLALRDPAWKSTALRLLRGWSSAPHVLALLACSDLLEDPEIAAAVAAIRSPHWFTHFDAFLNQLPEPLRRAAPQWVRHLGFEESEKLALLSQWASAPDLRLRAAALYALALLDTPAALKRLRELGNHAPPPLAAFVRWYLAGRAAASRRVRAVAAEPAPEPEAAPPPTPAALAAISAQGPRSGTPVRAIDRLSRDEAFHSVWSLCKQFNRDIRQRLLARVREKIHIWRPFIVRELRSRDPVSRGLALQVVGTSELAPRFLDGLESLRNDPVESIRRAAQALLQKHLGECETLAARAAALATRAHDESATSGSAEEPADANDGTRRELVAALDDLLGADLSPEDVVSVQRVRALLAEAASRAEEPPAEVHS